MVLCERHYTPSARTLFPWADPPQTQRPHAHAREGCRNAPLLCTADYRSGAFFSAFAQKQQRWSERSQMDDICCTPTSTLTEGSSGNDGAAVTVKVGKNKIHYVSQHESRDKVGTCSGAWGLLCYRPVSGLWGKNRPVKVLHEHKA